MKVKILFLTAIQLLAGISLNATVYYVKPDATGNGTSWNNASGSIQDMIDNASAGDEVWVAAGTYFPTHQTDAADVRSKTFLLKNGVHLYGGFAGTETAIDSRAKSDRDNNDVIDAWEFTNETTLSGNIDGIQDVWEKVGFSNFWRWSVSNNSGNSNKVVTCPVEIVNETLFDGFTVSGGNKGGLDTYGNTLIQNCMIAFNDGGNGVWNDIGTVNNCYIYHNSNAGILNNKGIVRNSTIDANVHFVSNLLIGAGGGILNSEGEIINCKVLNNFALLSSNSSSDITSDAYGGGIYNTKGKIEKCLVMNNTLFSHRVFTYTGAMAFARGGGIYNREGVISNCCVYNNEAVAYVPSLPEKEAPFGGGVYSESGATIYNTTMINNRAASWSSNCYGQSVTYNIITDATNIEQNFIRPTSFTGTASTDAQQTEILQADWRLKTGSGFIDAGATENLPDWILNGTDLAGNPRVNNGAIDLGAYEYSGETAIDPLPDAGLSLSVSPSAETLLLSGLQGNETLSVYSLSGSQLLRSKATGETKTLSIRHLPAGMYLLSIQSNKGVSTHKFIKK